MDRRRCLLERRWWRFARMQTRSRKAVPKSTQPPRTESSDQNDGNAFPHPQIRIYLTFLGPGRDVTGSQLLVRRDARSRLCPTECRIWNCYGRLPAARCLPPTALIDERAASTHGSAKIRGIGVLEIPRRTNNCQENSGSAHESGILLLRTRGCRNTKEQK